MEFSNRVNCLDWDLDVMSTLELDKLKDFWQQKEHVGSQKLFAIDIKELN